MIGCINIDAALESISLLMTLNPFGGAWFILNFPLSLLVLIGVGVQNALYGCSI